MKHASISATLSAIAFVLPFLLFVSESKAADSSPALERELISVWVETPETPPVFRFKEDYTVLRDKAGEIKEIESRYTSQEGEALGFMKTKPVNSSGLVEYEFEDFKADVSHSVKVDESAKKLILTRKKDGKTKSEAIELKSPMIAGQGSYIWLLANAEKIVQGDVPHARFAFPGLLSSYECRARKIDSNGDVHRIRLELDNWFLRLVGSSIEVKYDARTKKIIEYRGPSVLGGPKNNHPTVVIRYDSP